MKEKTSLEKSHSFKSNFVLTFICLMISVSFSGLFVIFALKDKISSPLNYIILGIFGGLFVLNTILLSRFKR